MSKLKRNTLLFSFIALLPILGALFINAAQTSSPAPQQQDVSELFSPEAKLWGKASGPVQVRIEFKEQKGDRVTLEGQIRSTLPDFFVEWKLPKGVQLVEGQLKEKIHQDVEQMIHTRTLVVDVTWPLKKPHLVLKASEKEEGESFGAATVFNLDPSLQEMEKKEIIRAHMKSRKIRKLVK